MNKAFFTFIKSKIAQGVPELSKPNSIQIWNSQTKRAFEQKKEKFFPIPACFVEFIVDGSRNISLGLTYVDLRIRFRFAIESRKFERLDDLDFLDRFDAVVNTLRGNSTGPVQFSSLQSDVSQIDGDHTNVNEPYLDYITCWSSQVSYTRKTDKTKLVTLVISYVNHIP